MNTCGCASAGTTLSASATAASRGAQAPRRIGWLAVARRMSRSAEELGTHQGAANQDADPRRQRYAGDDAAAKRGDAAGRHRLQLTEGRSVEGERIQSRQQQDHDL